MVQCLYGRNHFAAASGSENLDSTQNTRLARLGTAAAQEALAAVAEPLKKHLTHRREHVKGKTCEPDKVRQPLEIGGWTLDFRRCTVHAGPGRGTFSLGR